MLVSIVSRNSVAHGLLLCLYVCVGGGGGGGVVYIHTKTDFKSTDVHTNDRLD